MNLKQWCAGFAIALMAFQPAVTATAAWPDQFSDVNTWPSWAIAGEWLKQGSYTGYDAWGGELAEAAWWELMVGDPSPDGWMSTKRTFRPNDTITRAEYATILVRAMDLPIYTKPGAAWYQPYVDALQQRGIIQRQSDFMQPILRAEMGEWIGRSLKWYGLESASQMDFSDTRGLPEAPMIRIATGLGVIKGYPDGTYGPARTATRTEGAVMAVRLVKQLKKHPATDQTLDQYFRAMWAANTELERMAHKQQPYNRGIIAPYVSDLYLDGPSGVHYWFWWEKIGSTPGWRVLDNLHVEVLLARDTVAIVKATPTLRYTSDIQTMWGDWALPHQQTHYVFLFKRNGQWIMSEAKTYHGIPEAYRPKAEGVPS